MGAPEWKDETVDSHKSGITDLVTSSDSSFQEICDNLNNDFRLNLLSSRPGYKHWCPTYTPSKIQQLIKMEDWIIAYCYDDSTLDPDDQCEGRLYYRLETDQVSEWAEVPTPKERTESTLFRVYDSANNGFTLETTDAGSAVPYDNFVVKDGSNPGSVPVVSYNQRDIILTVDKTKLDADGKYDTGGAVTLKYSFFASAFVGANFTSTLFTGTAGTDEVIFDEKLFVQSAPAVGEDVYVTLVRSDGNGSALPYIDEQGHLQSSDWQSHVYQAFEPFDKTFTPNPLDPYGKDPDTYPPDNNRLPLRKIAPIAAPVGEALSYSPNGINAQLPATQIGIDLSSSEADVYSNAIKDFRYQCWELKFDYFSATYLGEETATIKIWCERSWGQVGSVGDMSSGSYLRYQFISGAQNPFDSDMQFGLADYQETAGVGLAPYETAIVGGIAWGELYLCWHELDGSSTAVVKKKYSDVVSMIGAAFAEYQSRSKDISSTNYTNQYQKFGYYIQVNPKAIVDAELDLDDAFLSVTYHDNLPEDVSGNFQYGYAFYLRDSYEGQFEGSPREFLFDGPTSFTQVRTLSKIGLPKIKAYTSASKTQLVEFSTAPEMFGGIAARMLRSTDLYYQSSMDGVFARTTAGGSVYYIDTETKYWWRTEDLSAPTLPQALIDDNWEVTTAYVVPHQSSTTDEDLIFNEAAYFNNGVLSYDSVPQGPFYFTITNQVGYYVNIVGNIQRVYQSTPGIPHASPSTLFTDFNDGLTGAASFLDKPILFTQNNTWRMEGVRSSDGIGRTFIRTVSDEYGCIANQSIVLSNVGLFYWSNNGIIYTDGLRAFRVTEHLINSYTTWLSWVRAETDVIGPRALRGSFDEVNRLIFWSTIDASGKPFFVTLSLENGISTTMPVRTHSGYRRNSIDESTGAVTAIDYFQTHATLYSDDFQRFYRSQGTHLLFSDASSSYDEADQTVDYTEGKTPVVPFYKSIAYSYGLPWSRKYTTRVMLNLRDLTGNGVSMTPLGWNDLNSQPQYLFNCLNYQHLPFSLDYDDGNPLTLDQFWGHLDVTWKSNHIVSYKRHFPKGRIRNVYKQVGFTSLQYKYGELSRATPGVVSVHVIYKAGFPQATVFIEITVEDAMDNPFADLGCDVNGRFMLSWDEQMRPVHIQDIALDGNTYQLRCLSPEDNITNVSDFTYIDRTVSFYRLFTDQKIDMIGYNLTYRLIGDRTHGMPKSTAQGGTRA